jgi:co-chaperonin GroES (HSP10)
MSVVRPHPGQPIILKVNMITPIRDKVAVTRVESKKVTDTGIIVTRNINDVDRAKVIAIGPDATCVSVGNELLIDWNKAVKSSYDGQEIYLIKEEFIVAVFE